MMMKISCVMSNIRKLKTNSKNEKKPNKPVDPDLEDEYDLVDDFAMIQRLIISAVGSCLGSMWFLRTAPRNLK